MRIRSLLAAGLIAAATLACSSNPKPAARPSAKPVALGYGDPAPFATDRIDETILHDAKREKELSVSIDYPKAPGPFPVIVFSHGFGGSKDAYRALTASWAAHGYVVVKPTHSDTTTVSDIRDLLGESSVFEKQNERDWLNRARDVSLVIDSLPELEHRNFELRGKIDATKVGVAGHSYGAFTAMLVAGAHASTSARPVPAKDPRVVAGLAMSPQGVSSDRGLTDQSWSDVTIPMLYMTGTLDRGTGETPEWRRDPFKYAVPGDKYFVSIRGARHLSFTGRFADQMAAMSGDNPFGPERPTLGSPSDPTTGGTTMANDPRYPASGAMAMPRTGDNSLYRDEPVIFAAVLHITQAFWDAYLKNNEAAKQYLASQQPQLENKVKLTLERK